MSENPGEAQARGDAQDTPLDVLVVGGGPCGTAVAFRSMELGMTVLVIELDDLLKRIRDYAKDKQILPSFGGGDQQMFPAGGEFVARLQFEPIDKDDMCALWKRHYSECQIPHQTGVELTGLERASDGTWVAKAWNHRSREEVLHRARHVVIAMGRGVPRRFDIPGSLDGIAFRLDDPRTYVEAPICVVGGGTSAAEAVIAVSNAKVAAQDPSTVHWCYRGDKMPLVSKALAEVFFEAHLMNGNIRFHPNSEPSAIVVGPDKAEYFSIRTDRRVIPGRPPETMHLEFPKTHCIACIGEDIPEAFLKSLGIEMMTGGPKNKKRMVVTPLRETVLENVYMIGDILSPAYLETEVFDGDPATFKEVQRRGNVKMALHDGVFVAEVIRQKLDGAKQIQVDVEDAVPAPSVLDSSPVIARLSKPVEAEAPPVASGSAERVAPNAVGVLIRMVADNVEAEEYPIKPNGVTTIGRQGCDINIPDDTLLSDNHASISHGPDGCFLRDDGSATGVFMRVPEARAIDITPPALVRAGRQFLRFIAQETGGFEFIHYDLKGKELGRHPVPRRTIVVGRDSPDLVLDGEDKSLSRRHLAISLKDEAVRLKDLKSLNGTYMKVENGVPVEDGDEFRVGRERFVLALGRTAASVQEQGTLPPPVPGPAPEATRPAPAQPVAPLAPVAIPTGEPAVTIKNFGKTIPVKRGQSICEAIEASGLHIDAECHAGVCGSDPIRILEGQEHLNACGDGESETLDDICGLEPGPCRLSCMTRPTGPVVIEIVEK